MEQNLHRLRGKLEVETELGTFLGDTRIRLLESIDKHGSITKAAKAVPLSYKAAWDAIDTMNNLAERPLVSSAAGGRQGGGTALTDYGRQIVALYRAVESEYQIALDHLIDTMQSGQPSGIAQFRQLLRRMSMKTSVRNQFAGHVVGLRHGPLDCEVRLKLDDQNEIVAIITQESAEQMALAVGSEVNALVMSAAILLFKDRNIQTSARNHLAGTITRIHEGPVNAEVILDVGNGKTVSAVVTRDSIDRLGLSIGDEACAVFKASAVILSVYS